MARGGSRGAERALKLAEDPTSFLSTVQIGITLIGIFAGAYSGATLSAAPRRAGCAACRRWRPSPTALAFGLVVVATTYVSLIIGELVPKRLALRNAEGIAAFVAGPMTLLAAIGAPVVWFLRVSTEAVLGLLRLRGEAPSAVTEEEVKAMIAEGTDAGVFHEAERELLEGVIRFSDRPLRSAMVPRHEIVWLDVGDPLEESLDTVLGSGHSRFPLCEGTIDEVVGFLHVKDILEMRLKGGSDLRAAAREPLYVSESIPALRMIELFRSSGIHIAMVIDEYGSLEGLVTPTDILTGIAGDLPDAGDDEGTSAVQREDGSWLLDGSLAVDAAARVLGMEDIGGRRLRDARRPGHREARPPADAGRVRDRRRLVLRGRRPRRAADRQGAGAPAMTMEPRMKVASFNINGIKARLPALLDWLRDADADVVVLQEIKATDDQFPRLEIEEMGYSVETHGQKGFNGVALLSRLPLEDVRRGLPGDDDRRAGALDRGAVVRGPAARPGLRALPAERQPGAGAEVRLQARLDGAAAGPRRGPGRRRGGGGGPRRLQRHPRGEGLLERRGAGSATRCSCRRPARPSGGSVNLGLTDALRAVDQGPGIYTFWDYQAGAFQKNWGIRIDHVLLTPQAADRLETCGIDAETRSREKPSDHVPIWVTLE